MTKPAFTLFPRSSTVTSSKYSKLGEICTLSLSQCFWSVKLLKLWVLAEGPAACLCEQTNPFAHAHTAVPPHLACSVLINPHGSYFGKRKITMLWLFGRNTDKVKWTRKTWIFNFCSTTLSREPIITTQIKTKSWGSVQEYCRRIRIVTSKPFDACGDQLMISCLHTRLDAGLLSFLRTSLLLAWLLLHASTLCNSGSCFEQLLFDVRAAVASTKSQSLLTRHNTCCTSPPA